MQKSKVRGAIAGNSEYNDASYSIYLTDPLMIGLVWPLSEMIDDPAVQVAVSFVGFTHGNPHGGDG